MFHSATTRLTGKPGRCAARILLAILMVVVAATFPGPVFADSGTPTVIPTPVITIEPSPRPSATLTSTPRPVKTAMPRLTPTREVARSKPGRRHRRRNVLPTPTATAVRRHRRHHRRTATPKPTGTPTPTVTATPPISLTTDDSIAPVTCNGAKKLNASYPFLYAPYHGWTSIVSYFDHDMPNFSHDGLVQTATGLSTSPDKIHSRTDFPAYWNAALRQYVFYDGHNGYDFNLWYQPVYAAAAGKVIFSAFEYPDLPDHGYGLMVMIDHRNGYVSLYGHVSRLMVHKGQRVKRGQVIGISGNTGHSTGPHLHFTLFHNCSPTDPYGWSGPGPDPLQNYQQETSTFLWRRPPLVSNPIPHWPQMSRLPASSVTRIVLLRLPATRRGTSWFTRSLETQARALARLLRVRGLFASIDYLRGGIIVDGTVSANEIYHLPGVASIATPDTEEGARADVLRALGRAALATKHARLRVARSSTWSGYIVRWHRRTILVGTGARGQDVNLKLQDRGQAVGVHHLHADPETGAFAVDLGSMSRAQTATLTRELEGRGTGGSSIVALQPHRLTHRSHQRADESPSSKIVPSLIVLALLALAGVAVHRRIWSALRARWHIWPGRS